MQLGVDLNFASILYRFDLVTFSCDFPGQEVMALQAMRRSGSRFIGQRYALPEVPKQMLKVLMVLTDVSFEQTYNEPN